MLFHYKGNGYKHTLKNASFAYKTFNYTLKKKY